MPWELSDLPKIAVQDGSSLLGLGDVFVGMLAQGVLGVVAHGSSSVVAQVTNALLGTLGACCGSPEKAIWHVLGLYHAVRDHVSVGSWLLLLGLGLLDVDSEVITLVLISALPLDDLSSILDAQSRPLRLVSAVLAGGLLAAALHILVLALVDDWLGLGLAANVAEVLVRIDDLLVVRGARNASVSGLLALLGVLGDLSLFSESLLVVRVVQILLDRSTAILHIRHIALRDLHLLGAVGVLALLSRVLTALLVRVDGHLDLLVDLDWSISNAQGSVA